MPQYAPTAITAKRGINYVRTIVEGEGSLFIQIEQENDLGIDALIELIRDGSPLFRQIAVQIKSGQSYFNVEGGECLIPIGDHREYWQKHRLPVVGLVYVPAHKTAYWIDIKSYLKAHPNATTIRFRTREANRFDSGSFTKVFVPGNVGKVLSLPLTKL